MVIIRTTRALSAYLAARIPGPRLGFIPTLGALHDGHLSLVREARDRGCFTVCSIFVNPTQFNDPADYAKYPKTIDQDVLLLEGAGVDVLFLPSVEEMYPNGTQPTKHYDLGYLETVLEGKYRPGHFQGVCQVVERLLRIVRPDDLFMGQKDYQQCMVIKRLIVLESLPVNLVVCPIRRESDGLAMSSRNLRLDEARRQSATALFQALEWIKTSLKASAQGDPVIVEPLMAEASDRLTARGFRVDYVAVADADDLTLLDTWGRERPAVILIAAYSEDVRLIDNELL